MLSGIFGDAVLAQYGRRNLEVLLEEFYEMGDIGEATLNTHLRNGLTCRYKHNLGSSESLCDDPTMWWCVEYTTKLLLERGERTVGEFGKTLDGDVAE